MQNFQINSKQIDSIKEITTQEKNFRIKNLELFKSFGFPNKNHEDWKFTDFKKIVDNNFKELDTKTIDFEFKKIELIKDFPHNYIFLVNGIIHSSNFEFEEKNNIKLKPHDNNINYEISKNPLICLNHAFAENGYLLEIEKNYKFNKTLIIYNYFTKNLRDKILNNKNTIKLKENSEIHIIEYTINESKFKFINNTYEDITLEKNSKLKSLCIQKNKVKVFFINL